MRLNFLPGKVGINPIMLCTVCVLALGPMTIGPCVVAAEEETNPNSGDLPAISGASRQELQQTDQNPKGRDERPAEPLTCGSPLISEIAGQINYAMSRLALMSAERMVEEGNLDSARSQLKVARTFLALCNHWKVTEEEKGKLTKLAEDIARLEHEV